MEMGVYWFAQALVYVAPTPANKKFRPIQPSPFGAEAIVLPVARPRT